MDNWHSPDSVLLHEFEHIGYVGVSLDAQRFALTKFFSGHRGRIAALGDALHDDVAVGDDPVQPVVIRPNGIGLMKTARFRP